MEELRERRKQRGTRGYVRNEVRAMIAKRAEPSDFIVWRDCPYMVWMAGLAFQRRAITVYELDAIYWWCQQKMKPTVYGQPGDFPFDAEVLNVGKKREVLE